MAEAKKDTKINKNAESAVKAAPKSKTVKSSKQKTADKPIIKSEEAENGIIQEDDQNSNIQESREVTSEKVTAKAGKRSAKALAEAEEKITKEERKTEVSATETTNVKPRKAQKPARSRLERRGKNFRKAVELIEKGKVYGLAEALELATKTSPVKFDASVELHIRLNVDPKQADQNIRDVVALPAGTGKNICIAVFADDKVSGADLSGIEAITKLLDKEQLDFDVLISTPANMAKLGKYARVLGPRGLMPNPKSGTVTADLAKAVSEAKAGRVEYRVDSTGIVHLAIGKVSIGQAKLLENAQAVATSLKANKPSSIKGTFIRSSFVTTSMGPSIATTIE
jgi:large subunit ribosomal protein L1